MPRRVLLSVSVLILATVQACAPGDEPRPVPDGPNVLLLTIDTFRSDHVGCLGAPGNHTPRIDALAAQSTLFENCLAPISTTFPSHASILTGLYPRFHGVRWNGHRLDESFETLTEILEAEGWDTGAFVALKSMLERGGLEQGFHEVSDREKDREAEKVRHGADVNGLVKKWLSARKSERPFFLWVHYYEPHGPYPVTDYARDAMAESGYAGPFKDGADWKLIRDVTLKDPADRKAIQDLYAGRVRDADRLTGELLDLLDSMNLMEKTAVILTGDHGQMLGEAFKETPLFGHGPVLWEGVLKVPLIVRDPARPEPRRVAQRVGLVDIMPTLLDFLGFDPPAECQGRSLLAALDGDALDARTYVAEVRVPPPEGAEDPAGHFRDRVAVYREGMKVVFPDKVVYDLERADPELNPLPAGSEHELIEKLDVVARRFLTFDENRSRSSDLDEDDLEELRKLGYVK